MDLVNECLIVLKERDKNGNLIILDDISDVYPYVDGENIVATRLDNATCYYIPKDNIMYVVKPKPVTR